MPSVHLLVSAGFEGNVGDVGDSCPPLEGTGRVHSATSLGLRIDGKGLTGPLSESLTWTR